MMISEEPERLFDSNGGDASGNRTLDARETYDERLNHLLEAATGLIAREGYEKASMRAVARSAGVSLAGLYHYFDSKEKMLFLIQFRTFNALLNRLRERLHGIDDPVEQLRIMIRSHLGYFAANMAALKTCSHELDSLSGSAHEETREIRRSYYEITHGIVDRVLEEGGAGRHADCRVATMSLFGMLNWLYRWYDPSRGPSPGCVAAQIADQFLYGLTHVPRACPTGDTLDSQSARPEDTPGITQTQEPNA